MQDQAVVQEIAKVLYDKKGFDIVALRVGHMTVICDYMVIASGRNTNQVKAMADDVEDRMAELNVPLRRAEGGADGRWIIMDYGNVMVHVFHKEERDYYRLERLWEDGTNRVELPFEEEPA